MSSFCFSPLMKRSISMAEPRWPRFYMRWFNAQRELWDGVGCRGAPKTWPGPSFRSTSADSAKSADLDHWDELEESALHRSGSALRHRRDRFRAEKAAGRDRAQNVIR